jgi:hypothetical protein
MPAAGTQIIVDEEVMNLANGGRLCVFCVEYTSGRIIDPVCLAAADEISPRCGG